MEPTKSPLTAVNERIVPACILSTAEIRFGPMKLARPKFAPFERPKSRITTRRKPSKAKRSGMCFDDKIMIGMNRIPLETVAVKRSLSEICWSLGNTLNSARPIVSETENMYSKKDLYREASYGAFSTEGDHKLTWEG